jgi:hypothetical protein
VRSLLLYECGVIGLTIAGSESICANRPSGQLDFGPCKRSTHRPTLGWMLTGALASYDVVKRMAVPLHSISSSAATNKEGGMVSPTILAVASPSHPFLLARRLRRGAR